MFGIAPIATLRPRRTRPGLSTSWRNRTRLGFLLCAAGLSAAPSARAQSQDRITLYGRVYELVQSVEVRGAPSSVGRFTRVTDEGSRLGVRGREDMGDGVVAWFQMEMAFPADSSSSDFKARNSGVGFEGPWGTFIAGRWDSAFNATQTSIVDPFDDAGLPGIRGAAVNQGNFGRRDSNVVQYRSPRVPGFRTRWVYQVSEGGTGNAKPHDYSVELSHHDPGSFFALAYEKHIDQAGSAVRAGSDEDGRGMGGFFHFGPVKMYGQYGLYRRTGTEMQKSYLIGFDATHGAHGLLGTYQNSRNGGVISSAQPSCDLVGAGYRYRFSLRTYAIVEYARVSNQVGALCNFGSNPVAITAGQDLRGFAVGMRTVF
jgi:predicted porin